MKHHMLATSMLTMLWILTSCNFYALAEVDLFASWFIDQYKETGESSVPLFVDGKLPSYIQGSLLRLGPSINHTPDRNYTNFLDGFGRITKWELEGKENEVSYRSNLLRTNLYNNSNSAEEIVRHITQQPTQPKMVTGSFKIDNMDNTDVFLYTYGDTNSPKLVTLTDLALGNEVDMQTLSTLGNVDFDDDCEECQGATFSGSHYGEWLDPKTNQTNVVNWLGKKTKGSFSIMIYTMNPATRRRRIVGSVNLDWQPYSIHSLAVTGDYAVLVLGRVELDFVETGMKLCVSCAAHDKLHEEPTLVYVFQLSGESLDIHTQPEMSFEIPKEEAFFVFHYVNTYMKQDDSSDVLMVDMCAYTSMDGVLGDHVLGDMHNIMTPTIRNTMPYNCDALKRMEIDLKNKTLSQIRDLSTTDADGFQYRLELVGINPLYSGKPACWGYGFTMHVENSPRYSDMGIAKINLCTTGSDEVGVSNLFHQKNVYVGEPVFVPDPSQPDVEDAGSLLVVSKNGTSGDTNLLVINAKTMELVASVTAPIPTMFEFHGKFVPFLV